MKHWSVDTTELQKDKRKFSIWKLEQMINFGIGDDKVKLHELKKYWNNIDIDPFKRKFLAMFLAT